MKVQINPSSLKYSKGVTYAKDKRIGVSDKEEKYDAHDGSTLSFDIVFDETGIISTTNTIVYMMNQFEEVTYNIKGETHEPNYLNINWGSFLFKGRISSLSYDYTLFRSNGSPLRVKISVTIKGFMSRLLESKLIGRQSPDLSRIITLKSGESIPYWCNEIYGDDSYCIDIAHHNGLSGFRNVKPGTQLMFPPLVRNG